MSLRDDPISMVEACYDLHASEEAWLQNLANIARPLMHADTLIAYHVDRRADGWFLSPAVQSGDVRGDVVGILSQVAATLDRVRAGTGSEEDKSFALEYELQAQQHYAQPIEVLLLSEMNPGPLRDHYTLGVDVSDLHFSRNHHIDGNGTTFLVGSLEQVGRLRPVDRTMWLRLGAHIKAGLRLRRKLAGALGSSVAAPKDGAILDPAGKVVHAEGEAGEVEARGALSRLASEIDRARTTSMGRDADAVAIWEGLVDGRWSLVEQFDSDGRRYMLAHKNPEGATDPRGLTEIESRIARLAARGYTDKLIAYHLGIATGSVSSHLARAIRKLGVSGRIELVRLFASTVVRSA